MKKIGRPRKAQRKENISVNLPKHIVDQVNDALSWQSSRSKWIQGAIETKLNDYGQLDNVEIEDLIRQLFQLLPADSLDCTIRQLYLNGPSN